MSRSRCRGLVLLVEDEAELAQVLMQRLRASGYACVHAADGDQGLIRLNQEAPDAIVLDLLVPRKHGFLILRHLKSQPELRRVKTITMTAMHSAQVRAEALRLGADVYLEKPFDGEALVRHLDALLGPRAARQDRPVTPSAPTGAADAEGTVFP